jgi:hypothetical protein
LALIAGALADFVLQPLTVPILLCKNLEVATAKAPARSPFTECGLLSAVLLAATSFGVPQLVFSIVTLLAHAVAAAVTLRRVTRAYRQVVPKAINQALTSYAPRFLLYFSGNADSAYQLSMWIPYLERTGERYALIIREDEFFKPVEQVTTAPILLARTQRALEFAVPATAKAMFYVNNRPRSVSGIRFAGLEQVQLGHGDSEKPSSYDKSFAMFDQIFVAGQAGIDRFARNGVHIPTEKFRIVGRPQLEALEVGDEERPGEHVVLYAPTWRGGMNDMNYGSLAIGAELVSALLELGAKVVFRPHPFSIRDAESRIYLQRIDALLDASPKAQLNSSATAALSISECMNLSTALVCDVSSVASDYLYTGKPFAITDLRLTDGPLLDTFPIAAAAYALDKDSDPKPALQRMLFADDLADARLQLRSYYLGDFPAQSYADAFVAAAKAAMA